MVEGVVVVVVVFTDVVEGAIDCAGSTRVGDGDVVCANTSGAALEPHAAATRHESNTTPAA